MHNSHGPTASVFALSMRSLLWSLLILSLFSLGACRRNKRLLLDLEGRITVLSPNLDEEKPFGGTQIFKVRFEDADGIAKARLSLDRSPVWEKKFLNNTTQSTQTIQVTLTSATGETKLWIELIDRLGHRTHFERTLRADTEAPTVEWLYPTLTGMPKKSVEVGLSVKDISGIEWVRVKHGDVLLAEMERAPYSFMLDHTKLKLEPFFFQIEAKDKAGNIKQMTVPIPRSQPGLDEHCNEGVNCQARMYCIRVPPEKIGTCRKMCTGNEHCRAGFRCTPVGVYRVCMPYKTTKKAGPYKPCSPNLACIDTWYCIKTGERPAMCLPACDENPRRCPRGTRCTRIGEKAACTILQPAARVVRPSRKTRQVGQTCSTYAGCITGSYCIRDGSSEETRCRAQCTRDSDCGKDQFCDQNVIKPGACMPRQKQAPRASLHDACSDSLPCEAGMICVVAQGKGFCHKICNIQCLDAGQICRSVQNEISACFIPCQPNAPSCPKNLRCILSSIAPQQTPYICQ